MSLRAARAFLKNTDSTDVRGNMDYINYIIRDIKESEYGVLDDFLYEAIFVPEGAAAPPRDIIYKPELQLYVAGFGKKPGDMALAAEADGRIVGAVWVRIMNDYGHIDDETPSFALSLYREYRNKGIGTALMRSMLDKLQKAGYARSSLAVQKQNYAVKMYKAVGFEIVDETDEEYIMLHTQARPVKDQYPVAQPL